MGKPRTRAAKAVRASESPASTREREKRAAEAGLRRAVDLLVERAQARAGREGWSLLSAELRYAIVCRELVEELVTVERPKVAIRRDKAREIRAIADALERAYYAGRFG